jgi:hypothetical protein
MRSICYTRQNELIKITHFFFYNQYDVLHESFKLKINFFFYFNTHKFQINNQGNVSYARIDSNQIIKINKKRLN